MARRQEHLVACDPTHNFSMPSPETGAADVDRTSLRHITSADVERGAAQSEIGIFEVAFEPLLEQAYTVEHLAPENHGGPGRRIDVTRCIERRGVAHPAARAPGDAATNRQIERT